MTEFIKAIRGWTDRPCRFGVKVGCVLALALISAESSNAQVVKVAGEQPSALGGAGLLTGSSTRIASRRLVAIPLQDGKSEASPSDVAKDEAKKADADESSSDTKKDDEESKSESDEKAEDAKKNDTKPVTQAQSAELSLRVDPVNIATGSIGTGVLPENTAVNRLPASMGLLNGQARGIPVTQVCWKPANICHLPLYFEDAMLERHGHVRWGHAQPIVSGAKFFATMPLLPYIKTLQPPCEYRYRLGHFRPGSCAPALKDHLPWDRRAAVVETVSLGAFFWAAPL